MNLSSHPLVGPLSEADQALLSRRCTPVMLNEGQVLSTPDHPSAQAYFLACASVALVVGHPGSPLKLAVALVGAEGAVGLPLALGLGAGSFSWVVQSAGSAWCIDGAVLARLVARRHGMLMAFSRYLWGVAQEVATMAGASQICPIKQRVAGWVLLSQRRGNPASLHLTHAHLAELLGVRRASVTLAAGELKAQGLVDYRRGALQVLNPVGLAAVAGPLAAIGQTAA